MGVKRGDIVVVSAPGDYGKPRPTLVVQSDVFAETASVVVALLTSDPLPDSHLLRIAILPTTANGLRQPSSVMVSKLVTFSRSKISAPVGQLTAREMAKVSVSLRSLLGIESVSDVGE